VLKLSLSLEVSALLNFATRNSISRRRSREILSYYAKQTERGNPWHEIPGEMKLLTQTQSNRRHQLDRLRHHSEAKMAKPGAIEAVPRNEAGRRYLIVVSIGGWQGM